MTIQNGEIIEADDILGCMRTTVEAGENLTAGNAAYIKLDDGKAYVSDNTTADDVRANGIVISTVTSGSDATLITKGKYVTSSLTDKEVYYLGADGALTTEYGSVRLGVANGTTDLYIDIVQDDRDTIGTIKAWNKTYYDVDSGTTTSTTANKLVETGQNFETTISVGDLVHNTTDDTFAYVTAIDSDTTLSISSDIMASGETYVIYFSPRISAFWRECDGSAISDTESPLNGQGNMPDLNSADVEENYSYFLRGHTSSGETETSQNKAHIHTVGILDTHSTSGGHDYAQGLDSGNNTMGSGTSGGTEARTMAYTVVWIMKIK